jgi:hypothetical protein
MMMFDELSIHYEIIKIKSKTMTGIHNRLQTGYTLNLLSHSTILNPRFTPDSLLGFALPFPTIHLLPSCLLIKSTQLP